MGKVIDTDELLMYISDKAFSNDVCVTKTEYIYWLYDQLKDYFEDQGDVFDFKDERIEMLNNRLETLMYVKRDCEDIYEKLDAILNEQMSVRWKELRTQLDNFGIDGTLVDTGTVYPLQNDIGYIATLAMRKKLLELEIHTITFKQVDESIQKFKDDMKDVIQEFDNYFAINA
jgi:chaperonin cofactor prefoldin